MIKYSYEYDDGDYAFKADGYTISSDRVLRLLNDGEILAEQMNELSDSIVGYREGRFAEMIDKIAKLKLKAENAELSTNFIDIVEKVDELQCLIDDIRSGA